MIKKRKKMDKKKRRCLYGVDKVLKFDDPIENKIDLPQQQQPIVKKTKNGRVIDVKTEKEPTEGIQLKEESKPKRQCVKSTEEKKIEPPVEKIREVIEEKASKSSKLPPKTKQRYKIKVVIFQKYTDINFIISFLIFSKINKKKKPKSSLIFEISK